MQKEPSNFLSPQEAVKPALAAVFVVVEVRKGKAVYRECLGLVKAPERVPPQEFRWADYEGSWR